MNNTFDLIIVIPVGPQANVDFTSDTINSIKFSVKSSYKIIVIDDSQTGIGNEIKKLYTEVDLLKTKKNNGRLCGLYLTLCMAYRYAVTHYSFNVLFKVDTDALIINDFPEKEALEMFKTNPLLGMAGQYLLNYDGTKWDLSWPEDRIYRDLCSWRIIRNFFSNITLRKWYKKALKNGYKTGESVFGGAYFISEKCLKALYENGLLPLEKFKKINLEEDHLFSMLVKAIDFQLADLSAGSLPLACAWRGLPAHPEELLKNGKRVIHSTRYYKNLGEKEIREFFKHNRIKKHLLTHQV